MIAAQLRKRGYKAWLHVVSNGVDPAFNPDQKPHVLFLSRQSGMSMLN